MEWPPGVDGPRGVRSEHHSAEGLTGLLCRLPAAQAGAAVNQADSFGYTPLHMAALNEFSNYVLLLLAHGGDVTARTKGNVSVLSFIVRRTPDVLPKFVQRLDRAVRLHDHEIGDVDCELKVGPHHRQTPL